MHEYIPKLNQIKIIFVMVKITNAIKIILKDFCKLYGSNNIPLFILSIEIFIFAYNNPFNKIRKARVVEILFICAYL